MWILLIVLATQRGISSHHDEFFGLRCQCFTNERYRPSEGQDISRRAVIRIDGYITPVEVHRIPEDFKCQNCFSWQVSRSLFSVILMTTPEEGYRSRFGGGFILRAFSRFSPFSNSLQLTRHEIPARNSGTNSHSNHLSPTVPYQHQPRNILEC